MPSFRKNTVTISTFWVLASATFLALLPLVNPIGSTAIFAGLIAHSTKKHRRNQALLSALYGLIILVIFAIAGRWLLQAFGLSIPALQIAGGIVVAWTGFTMISPSDKLDAAETRAARAAQDISLIPMALPIIAGPGSIGVVVALAAKNNTVPELLAILAGIVVISILEAITLLFGTPLIVRLGPTGIGAITRVLGFFILAIGVQLAVPGVIDLIKSVG